MARWSVQLVFGLFVGIVILSLVASLVVALDWSVIGPKLVELGVMVGVLYWATTLLPGPIRKAGSSLGRQFMTKNKTKAKHR
jgi:hypothetical protein